MSSEYQPRNDHVLIRMEGDKHVVQSVGRLVEDLRPGDAVILPEQHEGDETHCCIHQLDEEGDLLLVREFLILAVEKPSVHKSVRTAYEDFHS